MQILGQEGFLLLVDEVPTDLRIGEELYSPRQKVIIRIVYIDRDLNEVGFEPVGHYE